MEIQKIPISKINPAPYNPRKDLQPGDKEYESLKRSISQFGYIDPIVWNKRTGNLIGGHQRFKILVEMGHKEVDASVVDYDDKTEKAANIALNKISGEWDFPKLKELLVELDDGSFDIELTGFSSDELAALIDRGAETPLPFIDGDDQHKFEQITFTLSNAQMVVVRKAISAVKGAGKIEVEDNENGNGNAIHAICEEWLISCPSDPQKR